ncbi:MAG: tetratricopeptide repeat protein [Saccharospirillaceae bacterium]|jgi:type IV pilus assembly protein PilF|nr:tetratricopeptide repeat protein [Saccharospirillaceae bacterium]
MSKGNRWTKYLAAAMLTLLLSACVTVVESPFNKKASPDKAVENYTQLGLAYIKNGRFDWARQRLNRALDINPDFAPAHDAMGLLWQAEGELDLAEESFKTAISLDEQFSQAKHHLGRIYTRTKRFEEANDELTVVAGNRYYENRVAAHNDLAINAYRWGKPDLAVKSYRESLRIMPYNVDALGNISTLLFEAQNYSESQKYFDRLDRLAKRQQTQHNAHSLWLGIKLAAISQNTDRAIQFASELKQNFPDSKEYKQYQQSLSAVSGNEL